MTQDGYKGGATIGGKWGCALAAIVGVPLLGLALLINALGDCFNHCHPKQDWTMFGAALVIAGVVGLTTRVLVNRFAARRWPSIDDK